MQRRSAVKQHSFVFDNLFQNSPDFRNFLVHQLSGASDVVSDFFFDEFGDDKRSEQFQSHVLRQTALAHLKLRTDDDNRTAGIIHSFSEQVLSESPLLAFQHFRQRLERPSLPLRQGRILASPHSVVQQGVNRFLQNSFFVAANNFGRFYFHQFLQAIVPVNDSSV